MLLLNVSLEPFKGVRRFVEDLAAFPETEEQVLAATLGQVAVVDVERQLFSAVKHTSLVVFRSG